MPTRLLSAYLQMLPPLQAEQSLLDATRIAVGTGSLKKGVGERIMRGWQRATEAASAPTLRPQSREQYLAQTAVVGIGVKFEKPDAS